MREEASVTQPKMSKAFQGLHGVRRVHGTHAPGAQDLLQRTAVPQHSKIDVDTGLAHLRKQLSQLGPISEPELVRAVRKIMQSGSPQSGLQYPGSVISASPDVLPEEQQLPVVAGCVWMCQFCACINTTRGDGCCATCAKPFSENSPIFNPQTGFDTLQEQQSDTERPAGCDEDSRLVSRVSCLQNPQRLRRSNQKRIVPNSFSMEINNSLPSVRSTSGQSDIESEQLQDQLEALMCSALAELSCNVETNSYSALPTSLVCGSWRFDEPSICGEQRRRECNDTPTSVDITLSGDASANPLCSKGSFIYCGSSSDHSPSTANVGTLSEETTVLTPIRLLLLKAKNVAEQLLRDFEDLGELDPCSRSIEVLTTTLAILGRPVEQLQANARDSEDCRKIGTSHGVGGPHFSAPAMLAHPDEFKNPSSFLKIYGDPMCGVETRGQRGSSTLTHPIKGKDGNWMCHSCNNINFPRRFRCNKCGDVRGEEGDAIVTEYAKLVYKHHLNSFRLLAASQGMDISLKRMKNKKSQSTHNGYETSNQTTNISIGSSVSAQTAISSPSQGTLSTATNEPSPSSSNACVGEGRQSKPGIAHMERSKIP